MVANRVGFLPATIEIARSSRAQVSNTRLRALLRYFEAEIAIQSGGASRRICPASRTTGCHRSRQAAIQPIHRCNVEGANALDTSASFSASVDEPTATGPS